MPKKRYRSVRKSVRKKKSPFQRLLSFFRGEGGIFVIFILASVMAGAFVMTGGLMPMLNQAPSANDQVLIDEDSAKQSEEKSLQLVDIKIKPTDTPTPTPVSSTVCEGNLLANPSFEEGRSSPPSGWGPGGAIDSSLSIIPDGTQYAIVTGNQEMRQIVQATPGSRYTLTFYSGSHVPGRQTVSIQYYSDASSPLGSAVTHTISYDVESGSKMGGPYTISLPEAPSNAKSIQVRVRDNGTDFAKVDSFCLKTDTTPTPTQPQPTPTEPLACLNKTAILVLADLSHSMQFTTETGRRKDQELQNALKALQSELRPETAIAIYKFGSYDGFSYTVGGTTYRGVQEVLAFRKYRGNESLVTSKINNEITYGPLGGTYLRNGFRGALRAIGNAKQSSTFDGYNYVTIVFSDGVPEISGNDGSATGATLGSCTYFSPVYTKCFALDQDPRSSSVHSTDLTSDMKSRVRKVYSVVIYDDQNRADNQDYPFISRLQELMKDVASGRGNPYYFNTTTRSAGSLTSIFRSIVRGICQN